MNILHMKYAVEVAKTGSINKAAEALLIAQPNLSRSIRELESELKITIFKRTSKGMSLTSEGEEFIESASRILSQVNYIEKKYHDGLPNKQRFSISVPRASYIADAFISFSSKMSLGPAEFVYKETNSLRTLRNIINGDYRLGIIRFARDYDTYYQDYLNEKKLAYDVVSEFHYVLITSKESSLAQLETIQPDDLKSRIEIAHADPFVPYLPISEIRKDELQNEDGRRIFVFERSSQFELLSNNLDTYMWVSPLPQSIIERFGLVQINCPFNQRMYRDLLIYKNSYKLSEIDKTFLKEIELSKKRCFI
ncbi:MAG: LysR family transcriptional regulator [Clostridia bacterium]|nr:LysR family transcriptional regulator [Clostridia bacterium]